MKKPPMVFIHGWGLAPDFWADLSGYFLQNEKLFLNLGYQGTEYTPVPAEKSIYITHSLGTMWALKNHTKYMKALVVINGFYNFSSLSDPRVLQAMKMRLKKNPYSQMQSFFEKADIKNTPENFNIACLERGLETLETGNEEEALKTLSCPILILAGGQDQIVPVQHARKQWLGYDLKICEKGGHALPVTHHNWCCEQTELFLK